MELNILHVYPDLMNLYGEYANLAVLRRHLEALDVGDTGWRFPPILSLETTFELDLKVLVL